MQERLQKLMSQAGIASRRESECIIRVGKITGNRHIVKIGNKAIPETEKIEVNGRSHPNQPYIIVDHITQWA